MTEETNPGKKLHDIINRVILYQSTLTAHPSDMPRLWTAALGISLNEFEDSLDEAVQLIYTCERFLRENDVRNADRHLQQLRRLKSLLFGVTTMQWGNFRQQCSDDFLSLLLFVGSDMSDHWHELSLSVEDLESLQTEIEDLVHDVVESELGDDIKRVIVDGLNAVRDSILEYRFRGMEGVRQALDKNVASLIRYRLEFDEIKRSDHEGIWARWSSVVGRLDGWVSTGLKLKQLAQPAISILMPGEAG